MPTNLLHNSQALVCKDKEPLAEKHVLEKTACIDGKNKIHLLKLLCFDMSV